MLESLDVILHGLVGTSTCTLLQYRDSPVNCGFKFAADIDDISLLCIVHIGFKLIPIISIAMWYVFNIVSWEFREFCTNAVFLDLTLCCALLNRYSLSLHKWFAQVFKDAF
jgi:hypothetical protein